VSITLGNGTILMIVERGDFFDPTSFAVSQPHADGKRQTDRDEESYSEKVE
jgi:hypothetical protein